MARVHRGVGSAAWPFAVRAQQPDRARRVGLHALAENDPVAQGRVAVLREGLARLGRTERNIQIEDRFAGGDADQMQAYAHPSDSNELERTNEYEIILDRFSTCS
jgi:hypothetical protein